MNQDLLQEKRQREKGDTLEEIEKDIINNEFDIFKKAKLEDSSTKKSKINSPKIKEINLSQDANNLENEDISELVFKYNSINTNIKCKICQRDISNNIKFFCNTCSDFIFCINCFVLSKHPKFHDYHILDNIKFPLYMDDWTANEEHKLLSILAKSGLNNWEEISKSMDNKGQVECESHYYSFYYTNKENPYPEENMIILDENKNIKEEQKELNKSINEKMILKYSSTKVNKIEEDEEEDKRQKRNLRSLCIRKSNKGGAPESISEILGCKPKRKEFDNEFLNDTEIEISHLEFNDNNDEKEKDLKIKMDILQDYNLILNEREKRKQFIFEKGLLDLRRQNRIESRLPKEQYDLLVFMKPFNRFYENSEFYDLFENIVIEQQLKLMLKNLNKLENEKNSKGGKLTTIEDIEKYLETEKNINKNRKSGKINNSIYATHEHNKNNNSNNYTENHLLADRIERQLEFNKASKEKKVEEIFDKDEYKLIKEMPLARSIFYEIKTKIKEIITLYENKKNNKSENLKENFEKIISNYGLERQTHIDILDFYYKKYNDLININENEIKMEQENQKINKNEDITYVNDIEDINEDSMSSNNNKHKKNIKKKEKIKNIKKKNNNTDIMILENESKAENENNHIAENIDKKKEVEFPKENNEINNNEKGSHEKIDEIDQKEKLINNNNNNDDKQKDNETNMKNDKIKEVNLEVTKC